MGQFEVVRERRHTAGETRTPMVMRPVAKSATGVAAPRPVDPERWSLEAERFSVDQYDTTPLPAVSGSLALAAEPAAARSPRPYGSRRSILIVEDDARTADVLRNALELEGEAGWEIEVAGEGLRALEVAALTPPDLVLLDVRLPGIDGAEVYRRLRATPRGRRVRVLFLSAGTSLDLYQRGIEDGVLLRKPFDVQDLVALVRAMLDA